MYATAERFRNTIKSDPEAGKKMLSACNITSEAMQELLDFGEKMPKLNASKTAIPLRIAHTASLLRPYYTTAEDIKRGEAWSDDEDDERYG